MYNEKSSMDADIDKEININMDKDIGNMNHTSNIKNSETHTLNIDIINNNLISSTHDIFDAITIKNKNEFFDNLTIDDDFFIESSILNISIHNEVNKLKELDEDKDKDEVDVIYIINEVTKINEVNKDKEYIRTVIDELTKVNIRDKLEELNKISEVNKDEQDEKEIDYIDELTELDELTEQNELKKDMVSSNYSESTLYYILQKDFYTRPEREEIYKSSNYNNHCFCYYCKNYLVLAESEISLFLNLHMILKKNSKYLILVFRLCPNIFLNYDIMINKYLRKYILNYLNLPDEKFDNKCDNYFNNMMILNQYFSIINKSTNAHIFENLFHQPNLKYGDYLKCDSCKNYMCPKHIYLANCYFAKCKICNSNNWTICGWCKPNFNEEYACEYIHNKM